MFDIVCILIVIVGFSVILYNIFDANDGYKYWKKLKAFLKGVATSGAPFNPTKPNPNPDETFSGVIKPSTTLAHLLVSEMLRSLNVKGEKKVDSPGRSYEKTIITFTFKSFQVKVDYGYTNWSSGRDAQFSNPVPEFYLNTDKGKHPFDARELSILKEGFDKFRKLNKQREEIEKEATRQNSALEAISTFMRTEGDFSD